MAQGLLVSFAGYPHALSSLFPDNGLASLAAVLAAAGHPCAILDLNTPAMVARLVPAEVRRALVALLPRLGGEPDEAPVQELLLLNRRLAEQRRRVTAELSRALVARCRSERLDFVGFKLWSGDGFEASLAMAERLRADCPEVKLFAGGPAVHYAGDVVREEAPAFDAVVDGDGEPAIVELARFAEGRRPLRGIPNLVAPSGGADDGPVPARLEALPLPSYGPDRYPGLHDGSKIRLICLDESRGCPIGCAFCINWRIQGRRWRMRRADQVVALMRRARSEVGTYAFRMAGTYTHPRLVREICEQLLSESLVVRFGLSMNAGGVTPELVGLLARAGCHGVFFGVESADDGVLLRGMDKPISAARTGEAIDLARRAGLFTVGSFIFPAPGETAATQEATRRFIQRHLAGCDHTSVMVTFPGLIPRTTWWRERRRFGFELHTDERSYRRQVLHYKIQHLLPGVLWEPLPYSLDGHEQQGLALRTGGLQKWAEELGVCTNLPDHDALVGEAVGTAPAEFKRLIRRLVFTGDGEGLQRLVDEANEGLAA